MKLEGSKTEANLKAAYAGESQARNKYTSFAGAARKEGYEQIAAIFQETAGNEQEHAKRILKVLGGIGETPANLRAAAVYKRQEPTQWRCRNALHAELHALLGKTQKIAEQGIEDNLDPGCVGVFRHALDEAAALQGMVKAERSPHISPGRPDTAIRCSCRPTPGSGTRRAGRGSSSPRTGGSRTGWSGQGRSRACPSSAWSRTPG